MLVFVKYIKYKYIRVTLAHFTRIISRSRNTRLKEAVRGFISKTKGDTQRILKFDDTSATSLLAVTARLRLASRPCGRFSRRLPVQLLNYCTTQRQVKALQSAATSHRTCLPKDDAMLSRCFCLLQELTSWETGICEEVFLCAVCRI